MTYRPKDTTERIQHRLKIARGHLDKVIQMIDQGEYCIDIIHQSQAVQRALEEADWLTLENHLKSCAADQIKSGKSEQTVTELMQIIRRSSK